MIAPAGPITCDGPATPLFETNWPCSEPPAVHSTIESARKSIATDSEVIGADPSTSVTGRSNELS